jgi:hypothetical protein
LTKAVFFNQGAEAFVVWDILQEFLPLTFEFLSSVTLYLLGLEYLLERLDCFH